MSIDTNLETTIENAETVPTVTVFSKNNCPICVATESKFIERGVPFREINVEEDTEPRAEFSHKSAFDHVLERYGKMMPAVVVENGSWGDSWTGRRPDKIVALISLFERLGATIPAENRAAHRSNL